MGNCEKNNKERKNEGDTSENKKKDRSCMNTKNDLINEGKEAGTLKETNDQGENGKDKNISGNNVDSNKGNIEDVNTNKKRYMERKEKDCRYFWNLKEHVDMEIDAGT